MTALYLERYLNYGLTMPEINDPKKPIIGALHSPLRLVFSVGRFGEPKRTPPANYRLLFLRARMYHWNRHRSDWFRYVLLLFDMEVRCSFDLC